jgi:hypothetical protein
MRGIIDYVNNSFLVFHQGTKYSKTIKHSRFALVFHTAVFSCLDPLMKHANSLFTYNMQNSMLGYKIILALLQIAAYFVKYTFTQY